MVLWHLWIGRAGHPGAWLCTLLVEVLNVGWFFGIFGLVVLGILGLALHFAC